MHDLLSIIKQVVLETMEASDPAGINYGTVVSESPLLVSVNQKLTLSQEFLVLTKNVMDYTVEMTSNSREGETSKTSKIQNGLKKGDVLIMIKQQGGQKYIILDKIANGKE